MCTRLCDVKERRESINLLKRPSVEEEEDAFPSIIQLPPNFDERNSCIRQQNNTKKITKISHGVLDMELRCKCLFAEERHRFHCQSEHSW